MGGQLQLMAGTRDARPSATYLGRPTHSAATIIAYHQGDGERAVRSALSGPPDGSRPAQLSQCRTLSKAARRSAPCARASCSGGETRSSSNPTMSPRSMPAIVAAHKTCASSRDASIKRIFCAFTDYIVSARKSLQHSGSNMMETTMKIERTRELLIADSAARLLHFSRYQTSRAAALAAVELVDTDSLKKRTRIFKQWVAGITQVAQSGPHHLRLTLTMVPGRRGGSVARRAQDRADGAGCSSRLPSAGPPWDHHRGP
jgi:hypothetical protein